MRCYSQKFDDYFRDAVGDYWGDFRSFAWAKAQACQESHLDPDAVSPVGAQGVLQVMPATYAEVVRKLNWDSKITAFNPERGIRAGIWYQGGSRRAWGADGRTPQQRNQLGLCAYNAGLGSCLKAQKACDNPRLWDDIAPCLEQITGRFSRETRTYVRNITQYAAEIGDSK